MLNREALRAAYEDVLIRIALMDISSDTAKALDEDTEDAPPSPKAIKAIDRAIRRANCRKLVHRTLPGAVCAAAWMMLAVYLAATVAFLGCVGVRTRFLSLFQGAAPLQAGVSLHNACAHSGAVPEGWTEKYYPTYIPVGWTFEKMDLSMGDVVYRKDADHILQFGVYHGKTGININFDGVEVNRISLNGVMVLAAENPEKGYSWVTWLVEGKTIVIYMDADLDKALNVASSVHKTEVLEKR